jgi:hypothetical protein
LGDVLNHVVAHMATKDELAGFATKAEAREIIAEELARPSKPT